MKALCLYLHMVLFVFQISQNEIWKFGQNLLSAKFGSERVKTSPQWPPSSVPMVAVVEMLNCNRWPM